MPCKEKMKERIKEKKEMKKGEKRNKKRKKGGKVKEEKSQEILHRDMEEISRGGSSEREAEIWRQRKELL